MNPKNKDKINKENMVEPFLLKPACKDYIWGGKRLAAEYGKDCGVSPLAETWECSTHPDGVSVVNSGDYKGLGLDELLEMHPELLGTHPAKNCSTGQLPILIKFIDAAQSASVQVHPDDAFAKIYENGQRGKAEMWYILDAEADSKLIYGFNHDMARETVESALKDGTIERYLNKVNARKDDVFYVEPGTVHAIGAGMVLVEIQQNSNLTYRMYDYDRKDSNGNRRELHVDKALQVMKYKGDSEPRQPMRVLKYQPGCAVELLCRCKYFQVERMLLNADEKSPQTIFRMDYSSFVVLVCLEGEARLLGREFLKLKKGDCLFVPAGERNICMEGKAQFLKIRC